MPKDTLRDHSSEPVLRNRRQLIQNTMGIDVPFEQGTLRVSNVPLFRDIDGTMHQAIRIRTDASISAGTATVIVRDGVSTLASTVLDLEPQATEFVWIPSVSESRDVTLDINGTSQAFTVEPQRQWTVHLIHHSHYDIGYTDTQADVLTSQLAFIDDALELATATDEWPDDARFRWVIEVNWPLRHWLRSRSAESRAELVRRVAEGRIEVNALPFSMHTEAYSYDELARQLEATRDFRQDPGLTITTAMQTDVPGSTIGLGSLLADAGVNFLAVAHNYAGRSIPHHLDGQELTRPFWWETPDGQKILVWYTDTLYGSAYMEAMNIGFGTGYEDVVASLPEYLNAVAQRNYPYGEGGNWIMGSLDDVESSRQGYPHDILHLRVMGAMGDNGPSSILPSHIVREWNETYAFPRLVTSTNARFRDDVLDRLGDSLDTFRGDWTDWWADGIGSAASALGRNRASQANIRTAQTMDAIATALGTPGHDTTASTIREAYEDMALFDEHTWGAANPWGTSMEAFNSGEHEWIRKAGFAYTAEERIDGVYTGALERLGQIAVNTTAGEHLGVFNPTGQARTDLVRMFIPRLGWPGEGTVLTEADTGHHLPYVLETQSHQNHRPFGVWITFLASNIAAMGYARYVLSAGSSHSNDQPSRFTGTRLETDGLSVDLDLERGSIASLVAQGRELVDTTAPFGFGAYIHDLYASGTRFNHLSSRIGRADPWILGSRGTGTYGHVVSAVSNDVYDRVTWRQTAQGAEWIETTLTAPRNTNRLSLSYHLSKPSILEKESVYIAFPFAGSNPRISFEITGGVVGPDSPHVPGSAQHFRAMRHFATIETEGAPPIAWATRQAPLVQQGNIHLPYAPFPTSLPEDRPGTIYSWALNNIWDTNFPPAQGGEMKFDYVVGYGQGTPLELGRDTGASASSPLVGIRARLGTRGTNLPDRGSFVSVDDAEVEVTHLSAEPGGTLAITLTSHATEPRAARLAIAGFDVASAESATFLGEQRQPLTIRDGKVEAMLRPGALQTVRLTMA